MSLVLLGRSTEGCCRWDRKPARTWRTTTGVTADPKTFLERVYLSACGYDRVMSTVEKSVEVDVPVSTAYNQWTQFESFPEFMDGVESITRTVTLTLIGW